MRNLNNYSGMASVVFGLGHPSVHRLKDTWKVRF